MWCLNTLSIYTLYQEHENICELLHENICELFPVQNQIMIITGSDLIIVIFFSSSSLFAIGTKLLAYNLEALMVVLSWSHS